MLVDVRVCACGCYSAAEVDPVPFYSNFILYILLGREGGVGNEYLLYILRFNLSL